MSSKKRGKKYIYARFLFFPRRGRGEERAKSIHWRTGEGGRGEQQLAPRLDSIRPDEKREKRFHLRRPLERRKRALALKSEPDPREDCHDVRQSSDYGRPAIFAIITRRLDHSLLLPSTSNKSTEQQTTD